MRKSFCVDLWRWRKHGSSLILRNHIKGQNALTKEERLLEDIMLHYLIDWLTKSERNGHVSRRKNSFSLWQRSISHVEQCTLKKSWIEFQIASASTVFSRPGPPATIIYSQTLRDSCVIGALNGAKKLNGKQKGILECLTKCIIWKG